MANVSYISYGLLGIRQVSKKYSNIFYSVLNSPLTDFHKQYCERREENWSMSDKCSFLDHARILFNSIDTKTTCTGIYRNPKKIENAILSCWTTYIILIAFFSETGIIKNKLRVSQLPIYQ